MFYTVSLNRLLLPATFRQICRFTASSDVRFFCFFNLFTSVTHFISGLIILFCLPTTRFSILIGRYLACVKYIHS